MNSTTWLIIKKDTRRFWPLLVLWCVALLVRVSLAALLGDAVLTGRGEVMFATILVVLVNVLLVVRVIGEDSPFKEAAFWRTRPISGGQMLGAKLWFLGGWTLALPCVVAAVASACYGFTLQETLLVVAGQPILHGLIGAGFAVCALFTHRVLVTVFAIWFGGAVLQSLPQVWSRYDAAMKIDDVPPESASLALTAVLLMIVVLSGAVWWAAACVYNRRTRWGAAGILSLGVVGCVLVNGFWRVDMLGAVPALNRLKARETVHHQVVVSRTDAETESTHNGISFRHLKATLDWTGVADGNYATYQVAGRLKRADGHELAQFHFIQSAVPDDLTFALKQLGIERVISGSAVQWNDDNVTLLRLRTDELEAFKGHEAIWNGWVFAKIGRMEAEVRVPLRSGATYHQGSAQFRLRDVEVSASELSVTFGERRPDTLILGEAPGVVRGLTPRTYVLINVAKGEAVMSIGGGGRRGMNDGIFQYGRRTLVFEAKAGKSRFGKAEWDEWLRDAELVGFRYVEEQRVKTQVNLPVTFK